MNKKGELIKKNVVNDDKEDLDIKKIAYLKNPNQKFLLYTLILVFCFLLSASILFINSYYKKQMNLKNLGETIEINTNKNNVIITNSGEINENITINDFNENKDYIIERINTIELTTNKEAKENGIIKFDIVLDILKNDFKKNEFASNDSELLARFSYSFDNNNWIYVNNVISTSDSTLNPLMGNYYDIAGINSNLKIATNYELKAPVNDTVKMYWKIETIIKNKEQEDINNNFIANFKIEYKDND